VKVFLDTNVLASALATRGLCTELFESVLADHELIVSPLLLTELRRILTTKLRISAEVTRDYIALMTAEGVTVATPSVIPEGIPDLDDAPLIAAALASGAECFVTGDKALLALNTVGDLAILSPRQFWERTRISR
jgi:putative PIN family toxin of toxin-antitoxin system